MAINSSEMEEQIFGIAAIDTQIKTKSAGETFFGLFSQITFYEF